MKARQKKQQKELLDEYKDTNVKLSANISHRLNIEGDGSLMEGAKAEFSPRLLMKDKGRGDYEIDMFFPRKIYGELTVWGIDEGFADMLSGTIRALRPKVVFETGTNKGRSTRAICEGLYDNRQGILHTVDLFDHSIFTTGAIPEEMQGHVRRYIGKLPDILHEEPLSKVSDIDFAFLDAGHTAKDVEAELDYVDKHRADECVVFVDNSRDREWHEVQEFLNSYLQYPVVNLDTMLGTAIVHMRGRDGYGEKSQEGERKKGDSD